MQDSEVRTAQYAPRGAYGKAAALTLALLGLLPALWPQSASAALGDTEASVSDDSVKLKATLRVAAAATNRAAGRYAVHELQIPAGTTIREFVSTSGVVFAVAWQGPFKPDMRLLLGRFFDTYNSAQRSPDSTRSRLQIEHPDLVVHAGGHMRSFAGLAYAPQLLPAGVSAEELK